MLSRLLTTITVSAAIVSAADICAYTARGCSGFSSCCTGISPYTCCSWPSNYGWGVGWRNMATTGWSGETYGAAGCGYFSINGDIHSSSDSGCLSVYEGTGQVAKVSALWWPGTFRSAVEGRDERNSDQGCRTPDVVEFTTLDGKGHKIKVPEGRLDEVVALLEEEEFEILLNL